MTMSQVTNLVGLFYAVILVLVLTLVLTWATNKSRLKTAELRIIGLNQAKLDYIDKWSNECDQSRRLVVMLTSANNKTREKTDELAMVKDELKRVIANGFKEPRTIGEWYSIGVELGKGNLELAQILAKTITILDNAETYYWGTVNGELDEASRLAFWYCRRAQDQYVRDHAKEIIAKAGHDARNEFQIWANDFDRAMLLLTREDVV